MRQWKIAAAFLWLILTLTSIAQAADLDQAPPPFKKDGNTFVPIDMQSVSIQYTFDYAARRAKGVAKISFIMGIQDGFPMFDLVPNAESIKLNGEVLAAGAFSKVSPPDGITTFRTISKQLVAGSSNEMEITFDISNQVTFQNGTVRSGFFMSDLSDRNFFEQYGPANMEYDHVSYDFTVSVVGAQKEQVVFTNGDMTKTSDNTWNIQFPSYFTASSIYFHITARSEVVIKEFTYHGIEASIPVTIYARDRNSVDAAYESAIDTMQRLENKLGPWTHNSLVIYVAGSGGMEYCGATMTSISALPHELTHSWFARGVMPSSGASGWMDEAIASWQDNDFRTARSGPNRSPANLANFSPYRRHTTTAAYSQGEQLIAEFDYLFQNQGGMTAILRNLFSEKKRDTITVEFFKTFVEAQTGENLQSIFDRYVYGRSYVNGQVVVAPERIISDTDLESMGHPRPHSKLERIQHR